MAESLFIEIVKPQGKNIVAGVIYRPPNQNLDEFLTMTNELLSKISNENKVCYLIQKFGFINGVDKCKLATVQRF